tara:strand:+ start:150 stop:659 length:510 start_codon:yes stop_codon:yes gene_type:complete
METPFVSEEFQKAFRNRFPGQVSSGRDLHVSDTIIPIVDFTPTASGTNLPTTLQFCRNISTTITNLSGSSSGDLSSTLGFIGLDLQFVTDGSNNYLEMYITNVSTGVNNTFVTLIGNADTTEQIVYYVPSGYKTTYALGGGGTHSAVAILTPLADVNGNIIQPSGYSPQ